MTSGAVVATIRATGVQGRTGARPDRATSSRWSGRAHHYAGPNVEPPRRGPAPRSAFSQARTQLPRHVPALLPRAHTTPPPQLHRHHESRVALLRPQLPLPGNPRLVGAAHVAAPPGANRGS